MKSSIAKKVTLRISLILLIALTVLFITAYLLVQRIIYDSAKSQNRDMLMLFTDQVTEAIEDENLRLTEDCAEQLITRGDYICQRYQIDFAYLFIPEADLHHIRYTFVAQNEKFNKINPDDLYIGKIYDYTMTEDEWAVWRGEQDISHSVTKSQTDYEISTMARLEDPDGNKVIIGVDQSYGEIQREILRIFSAVAGIIVLVIVAVGLLSYLVIRRRISAPATAVSRAMTDFIDGGERSNAKLTVKGNDEFAMIAAAFNSMTDDIGEYLTNIGNLTREQEQQAAQLDISAKIQRGFLKAEHFETDGCVIYANMIPAKYVAGDLYDYMPLGKGRFLTVIADVSGKGVSASIFMAVTLALIREFAKMDLSPAAILAKVNDTLCDNNPSMLFLTAIVGIYDKNDHTYTYANAGHNLPYVLGDTVQTLHGAQNTLLGLFPGEEFAEQSIPLADGETLFLYTDGVNEAVNADSEFFGTERLEAALRECIAAQKENPIEFINEKVAAFVGSTERHDDTTMLCFRPTAEKREETVCRDSSNN